MGILKKEVKDEIRTHLKENGIKKEQFSTEIGVTYNTLYRWLKDDKENKINDLVLDRIKLIIHPIISDNEKNSPEDSIRNVIENGAVHGMELSVSVVKKIQKHIIKNKVDFYSVEDKYKISQDTFYKIVSAKESTVFIPPVECPGIILLMCDFLD